MPIALLCEGVQNKAGQNKKKITNARFPFSDEEKKREHW